MSTSSIRHRIELFIDGAWLPAADRSTFDTVNPATEETINSIAAAGPDDVEAAVRSAKTHFEHGPWSRCSPQERARVLSKAADLIEADIQNLATLEALEIGKPYADARDGDLPVAVETFRCFAGWSDKLFGSTSTVPDPTGRQRLSYTMREPIGVVGAITPWNAPTMIAAWKIAPALAAGCTVVLKPPEDACLSTLRLVELLAEAGLPDGACNVLPGLGSIAGAPLAAHPGLDKVTFTGSPEVGRQISHAAGSRFRRVTLELGGKAPQLIFPDANLDDVMPTVTAGVTLHAGEVCAAGTRILAHHSIVDEVADRLAERAKAITVGDPFDPDTTMGALINQGQLDRVLGYIESGHAEGARLLAGGQRKHERGYFVEPTIFRGTNDLTIAREEIFGPVGTVIGFGSDEEALQLANDTAYGLNAMLWTNDLTRAHRLAAGLRVGMVWINGWGTPDQRMPWGGRAASGIGQELGLAGIEENTDEKTVSVLL